MSRYHIIKQKALNHWPLILRELGGLKVHQLKNEHQPCPLCGGSDRYRFDNHQGSGSWYCSHCGGKDGFGGGGDGFSLLMRLRKWDVRETTEEIARWLGETPRQIKKSTPHEKSSSPDFELVCPIPSDLPLPTQPRHFKLGTPEALWVYRNAENCPLMIVARFQDKSTGKKDVLPYTLWKKGEHVTEWRWKALPAPRPLYGLDILESKADARVLVVEGEKTADAARRLLPTWAVVTWPGGCKAINKVDWSPLQSRAVTIWPDNDAPGIKAAHTIARLIKDIALKVTIVRCPPDVMQGWDLADAEAQGWNTQRVLQWMDENTSSPSKTIESPNGIHLPLWYAKPSESEAASSLAHAFQGRLAYDPIVHRWYAWSDTVWCMIPEAAAKGMVADALDIAIPQGGYSYSYLSNCTQFLGLKNKIKEWPSSHLRLPLQNGMLELETRTLTDHKATDYFTWKLPFAYDVQAQCPTILAWLQEVTQGDQGMITILQAWLNAVVKGRVDLHRYLELIGPASTGKSTFLRLTMALIGPTNTVTTDLKQLEQNRFETASLYGKRLCLITDSSRYGGMVDVLKAITGGDPIRFEEKYCPKGNSFIPQCLVMIAANEPIQASDYTSGLQRRRLTLPFTYRIPPDKRDSTLEIRLEQELPGLLNWVLELSDSEVNTILRQPELYSTPIHMMTRRSLTETNPLAAWLDECVIYSPHEFTKIGVRDGGCRPIYKNEHLYPNYIEYCEITGHNPLSQQRFSYVLLDLCESLGYEVKRLRRSQGWMFKGLALKRDFYSHTPSMVTGYSHGQEEA